MHIPFCAGKCGYCDFVSSPLEALGGWPYAKRYLSALAVEMDRRAASEEFREVRVATIYIGGGTPSILPAEAIAELLARISARFACEPNGEVTIEANPGTVEQGKLRALRTAGVNRLSLGVQSFSDGALGRLGRHHCAEESRAAIEAAREAGFDNLNLDLMYGIPLQTVDEWRETVEAALSYRPEHLSAYLLSVEPETPLAEQISEGDLPPVDDDTAVMMYTIIEQAAEQEGYEHYEISNFARPGWECRHNRGYWEDSEYLGLGVSAASYRGGIRWNNQPNLEVYIEWVERGLMPVVGAETRSPRDLAGEMLMLGLRRAEGVSVEEIARRTGYSIEELYGEEIDDMRNEGLLIVEKECIKIPRDKWLVSNEVLARFIR